MVSESKNKHEREKITTLSRPESVVTLDNHSRSRPAIDYRFSTHDLIDQPSTTDNAPIEPTQQWDEPVGKQGQNVMSFSNPPQNSWRIVVCIFWSFIGGFSDAAPGALLPYIEEYYQINYAVTSLIWISNALGFILVACFANKIQPWLGREKSFPAGCASSCVMYAIVASGTKFPAIVVGFFFGGVGLAVVLAQSNIFLSRLDKQSKYLSFNHGAYGTGATVSPLIATGMVNAGVKWHYFYLILLGMMTAAGVGLFYVFQHSDIDLKPWDSDDHQESEAIELQPLNTSVSGANSANNGANNGAKKVADKSDMLLALKNPVTWLISFFVLFYQGSEVSLAGWVVTFFLDYRKGDASKVGYVASGFWGGLTIGRLVLTRPLHQYFGIRRSVIVISLLSIGLVVLTWVIPHVIVEAVLVSIAGVFIGPNYPLLITYTASEGLLPRKIQIVSMTIMTAFGSSGGALFPFIVGILSQSAGTYVVMPVFVGLYSVMIILWICLPNVERRSQGKSFWKSIW